MQNKKNSQKYNFWGDENREKLNQSPKSPASVKQLADIVNPVNLLDSIFSGKKSQESPAHEIKEKIPHKKANETLVFSYETTRQDYQLKQETNQILTELKKQVTLLQKSEKALSAEISKVKIDALPPKTGIYYLRYFEWLMAVIRGLRFKIEEGRNWLSTFNQRKSKKMGYWKIYKKHGTTFGMSQERTLATQTG